MIKLQYREIVRAAKRNGLTFGYSYDWDTNLCPVGIIGRVILGAGWYMSIPKNNENNMSARALARHVGGDPDAFAALECGYEGWTYLGLTDHPQYKVGQRLAKLRGFSFSS